MKLVQKICGVCLSIAAMSWLLMSCRPNNLDSTNKIVRKGRPIQVKSTQFGKSKEACTYGSVASLVSNKVAGSQKNKDLKSAGTAGMPQGLAKVWIGKIPDTSGGTQLEKLVSIFDSAAGTYAGTGVVSTQSCATSNFYQVALSASLSDLKNCEIEKQVKDSLPAAYTTKESELLFGITDTAQQQQRSRSPRPPSSQSASVEVVAAARVPDKDVLFTSFLVDRQTCQQRQSVPWIQLQIYDKILETVKKAEETLTPPKAPAKSPVKPAADKVLPSAPDKEE